MLSSLEIWRHFEFIFFEQKVFGAPYMSHNILLWKKLNILLATRIIYQKQKQNQCTLF